MAELDLAGTTKHPASGGNSSDRRLEA